jgi:hypothetical protein
LCAAALLRSIGLHTFEADAVLLVRRGRDKLIHDERCDLVAAVGSRTLRVCTLRRSHGDRFRVERRCWL